MADAALLLLQDELPEEADVFGVDDYSSESDVIIIPSALDFVSQDEMLTPLGRLDKYASSENIFNRQMVARSLLDLLKEVSDDERDCIAVLERVNRLADDTEPTVRAELMEQVPHIAMFCQENRPSIPFAFSKYLLPIVVRYLADQNNQVRKTSQAALLVLLEQELIERYDVETKVCPVLIELTAPDSNDDVKTEAVAIMCKMASLVGKDITERLILPRFCEMCCDCRMFHVRKVCAANFGDICSVVGQDATEEMLLPRFFQLCSDNVWGVRKACAECFMAVSCATSQDLRRTKLSMLFINLISDPSRWVRQAAFQSLGPFISTFANPSSSSQYFKEEDGRPTEDGKPAGDCNSSEKVRDSGDIRVDASGDVLQEDISDSGTEEPFEDSNSVSLTVELEAETEDETTGRPQKETDIQPSEFLESITSLEPCSEAVFENEPKPNHPSTEAHRRSGFSSHTDSVSEHELYNSFHYWRTPIPEIDIDLELLQAQTPEVTPSPKSSQGKQDIIPSPASNITMATRKELEEMLENLEPHIDDPDIKAQVDVLSAALRASNMDTQEDGTAAGLNRKRIYHSELTQETRLQCALIQDDFVPLISDPDENVESALRYIRSESDLSTNSSSPEDGKKSKIQDVVPQTLLDQYLSMTDPSRAQTVDTEIAKHCAYSLPGVALTLGRQNWHCLKDTYETLASDMQWKVRRTLAFSIHELAVILGDSLTAADLVPIFNGFLKDLDEVRIGVLKHLYDFLKLLHLDRRREYLYQLQEFLVTDNSRNWRFRAELAEQLILLLDLYSARDVYDYLRPISLSLCADKVSSVRWISYKLVSEMVKKLNMASMPTFAVDLMNELVERFCCSPKWSGRQTFVFICQAVLEDDCLPMDQFAVHLMPHLLHLASDRIPNVRVLLAKTLKQTLLEKEYFLNSANSHQEAVEQTIMALQMDYDNDVKYFASIHPASTKIADDAMSTASSTY
ncbi:serine/threonine-protein phosphatase 4 regulatory subunit 1 isoform X1 [Microcaecilia unicolor]|uniref:Serine/threonine-protein phosphatase 4 regulatory subunit 1 n=2 Tax=Microcaecilia unicolor TaxID=1415580 RepID=A0A6P7Z0I3_9AMPH|nr:serine/threonine-protein phosphatase 4 regulatory subunit 1 isoform X1 [Microcaecilia unicolor]